MGGFAQAVRRQGGLKDFSLGLDKIADILANRKLQQKLLDDQRRKDRQTTAFRNNADSYAGNIKSIYDKSAEDKEITPFESAEINKGLYDFRGNMGKYPLVDKELINSSDKAMSDLAKSLGTVVKPEEAKTTPYNQTKEFYDAKNQFELDKIAENLKADKDLAGYKAGLKAKTDKSTTDKEVKLDRSKLRGEISQGISKIKNLKKQLYTNSKTGLVDPKTVIDKEGNESKFYEIVDSEGVKAFDSPEQFTNYKEAIKTEYLPKMQELITKAGLDGALPIIRNGISKGLSPEEAIKKFAETNNLPQDDIQDLQNWFTLLGL